MPGTQWALAGTGTGILGAASHPWAPTPVQALGTSVGSPPLTACLQENFPADLGGQREGGAGLLPSNLDSWVYGRKRREADAVIKAIPEAVGGRQGAEPTRGCPHLCLPSCQKSQPQAGSRLLSLNPLLPGSASQPGKPGTGSHTPRVTRHSGTHACMPLGPSAGCGPVPGHRESPDTWLLYSTPHPWSPGPIFPEPCSLHIPEVSGQSLPRAMARGQTPLQGSRPGQRPGPEGPPPCHPVGPAPAESSGRPGHCGGQGGHPGLRVSDHPSHHGTRARILTAPHWEPRAAPRHASVCPSGQMGVSPPHVLGWAQTEVPSELAWPHRPILPAGPALPGSEASGKPPAHPGPLHPPW